MGAVITNDDSVTVFDDEVGTVTAPSEYEAWREIDRRKASRPSVQIIHTWTPFKGVRFTFGRIG